MTERHAQIAALVERTRLASGVPAVPEDSAALARTAYLITLGSTAPAPVTSVEAQEARAAFEACRLEVALERVDEIGSHAPLTPQMASSAWRTSNAARAKQRAASKLGLSYGEFVRRLGGTQ